MTELSFLPACLPSTIPKLITTFPLVLGWFSLPWDLDLDLNTDLVISTAQVRPEVFWAFNLWRVTALFKGSLVQWRILSAFFHGLAGQVNYALPCFSPWICKGPQIHSLLSKLSGGHKFFLLLLLKKIFLVWLYF